MTEQQDPSTTPAEQAQTTYDQRDAVFALVDAKVPDWLAMQLMRSRLVRECIEIDGKLDSERVAYLRDRSQLVRSGTAPGDAHVLASAKSDHGWRKRAAAALRVKRQLITLLNDRLAQRPPQQARRGDGVSVARFFQPGSKLPQDTRGIAVVEVINAEIARGARVTHLAPYADGLIVVFRAPDEEG